MFHERNRIREAQIASFHPGNAGFPPKPALSVADRLAASEAALLDMAIEDNLHAGGEMGALAVSIVADRATISG